jgi:hypothetical protein
MEGRIYDTGNSRELRRISQIKMERTSGWPRKEGTSRGRFMS